MQWSFPIENENNQSEALERIAALTSPHLPKHLPTLGGKLIFFRNALQYMDMRLRAFCPNLIAHATLVSGKWLPLRNRGIFALLVDQPRK